MIDVVAMRAIANSKNLFFSFFHPATPNSEPPNIALQNARSLTAAASAPRQCRQLVAGLSRNACRRMLVPCPDVWRRSHLGHMFFILPNLSQWHAGCISFVTWTYVTAADFHRKVQPKDLLWKTTTWSSWATGQGRRLRHGHLPVKDSALRLLSENM